MRILVACEESQRVTVQLREREREREHEVYSCDIEPCSGGHPEWHIQEDVLPLLNGNCEFHTQDGTYHKLVGCAVCGRPVSRHLDDGLTCEVNRLCTDGTRNACSMLYGACCRVAKAMGYRKVITYILQSEDGASLKASNFTCEGEAGGVKWTGERDRGQDLPREMKTRWVKIL